jgi:hypothetical protein
MQRPANRHHIEATDVRVQVLRPSLDHDKLELGRRRRLACLDRHRRLRVNPDDAADVGRETERQQTRPHAKINQRLAALEIQSLCRRCEEV